jgi:hypothetical protein
LKLVEQNDIITVEPMEEEHALALFEKKLGKQGEQGEPGLSRAEKKRRGVT